jgi:hypothetical protein
MGLRNNFGSFSQNQPAARQDPPVGDLKNNLARTVMVLTLLLI